MLLAQKCGLAHLPAQKAAWPRRFQGGNIRAPYVVFGWLVNGVIFTTHMIHRKATRESLLIRRVRLWQRVRLTRFALRLCAYNVFRFGQRQQLTKLGSVEKIGRHQCEIAPVVEVADVHGAHAVAVNVRARGPISCEHHNPSSNDMGHVIFAQTAKATRGSWQRCDTRPLPGLKSSTARASAVNG